MLNAFRKFEHRQLKPWLRRVRPYSAVRYADITVSYKPHLDGGGSTFGQDYIRLFRSCEMPKARRAFEWCAGPGFIGFSLLANGLADTLCLADVNPEAIAACQKTIARNGLQGRVSLYLSDNLKGLPAPEQWDLVVGNPPHFADSGFGQLRYHDAEWRIHREFFAAIGKHLQPGGMIVLQENSIGSKPATFEPMLAEAGLALSFVQPAATDHAQIFYLGISRIGDVIPAWARTLAERPPQSN